MSYWMNSETIHALVWTSVYVLLCKYSCLDWIQKAVWKMWEVVFKLPC